MMPSMRRTACAALVAVSIGAGTLAGCTSARNTLGTNSSVCYRALAVAEDAVHSKGQFAGVRLLALSSLSRTSRVRAVLTSRAGGSLQSVCLVSYRGEFRLDQVQRPAGLPPSGGVGHFAIVAVSVPRNVLLATVLLEREPVRFRHYEFGHFH